MYLMRLSGLSWHNGSMDNAVLFFKAAVLYNAFADHFLQDAFAAGHLPVNRSRQRGPDNNGLHDYFCRVGIVVENDEDDSWRAYGDGFYDTATFRRAVAANELSLHEVFDEFRLAQRLDVGTPLDLMAHISSLKKHPKDDDFSLHYCDTLLSTYGIYKLTPIPLAGSCDKLFGNSRSGLLLGINVNTIVNSDQGVKNNTLGFGEKLGVGYNLLKLTDRKKINRESKLWAGLNVNSNYRQTYSGNLVDICFGIESILFDHFIFEMNTGHTWGSIHRTIYKPCVGYEWKGIKRKFGLAFVFTNSIIPGTDPVYSFQIEYRRY
jgi:hypothetical protein